MATDNPYFRHRDGDFETDSSETYHNMASDSSNPYITTSGDEPQSAYLHESSEAGQDAYVQGGVKGSSDAPTYTSKTSEPKQEPKSDLEKALGGAEVTVSSGPVSESSISFIVDMSNYQPIQKKEEVKEEPEGEKDDKKKTLDDDVFNAVKVSSMPTASVR